MKKEYNAQLVHPKRKNVVKIYVALVRRVPIVLVNYFARIAEKRNRIVLVPVKMDLRVTIALNSAKIPMQDVERVLVGLPSLVNINPSELL